MQTMDLKGWWAVSDDGDDTVALECVGTMAYGEKGSTAAMLRNPTTRECALANYLMGYSWFAPADRAIAEAHAAKIVADYHALPDVDDVDDDEDSAEAA